MTAEVAIWRSDGVQLLRLARPEKKNALTGAMYAALSDAIEAGDADASIAAHVITGSGNIFTAGNDLGDFLATARGTGDLASDVLRFVRLLPVIRKPIIAAVNGDAIGIGTTLLFHCDLVYATPSATFVTPFLDLGARSGSGFEPADAEAHGLCARLRDVGSRRNVHGRKGSCSGIRQ
jgi:enoyl-CoA hydratase/carnithine racemase